MFHINKNKKLRKGMTSKPTNLTLGTKASEMIALMSARGTKFPQKDAPEEEEVKPQEDVD